MYIIRPITLDDYNAFETFAFRAGIGLTGMPKDPKKLRRKIQESIATFSENRGRDQPHLYLFVLENIESKTLIGCSSIYDRGEKGELSCFYRRETIDHGTEIPFAKKKLKILKPTCERKHSSEICSLYLLPEHRKGGLGRLLSLSRFLFIAKHKNLFDEQMIAMMRPVFNKEEKNPFWEEIASHFLNVDYYKLQEKLRNDSSFIPKVLPEFPIYETLLPDPARESIGKVHSQTLPALKMLQNEGFSLTDEIEPFDAGPKVSANTNEIRAIRDSYKATITTIDDTLEPSTEQILSNDSFNFRACFGKVIVNGESATVSQTVAHALQVTVGDQIRYCSKKNDVLRS